MAHPKPIKIFSNVTRGVMFFEGSTVTPKVLGIVNAYINPSISNRIVVERTDQQDRQGRNRRIFSKLQPARVHGDFKPASICEHVPSGPIPSLTRPRTIDHST